MDLELDDLSVNHIRVGIVANHFTCDRTVTQLQDVPVDQCVLISALELGWDDDWFQARLLHNLWVDGQVHQESATQAHQC